MPSDGVGQLWQKCFAITIEMRAEWQSLADRACGSNFVMFDREREQGEEEEETEKQKDFIALATLF